MSTQKYYLVIVNYQTSQNGNDGTARIRVKADNEAQAIELATKKASSYTRVGKVVGGHVDGSPAPTDWAGEYARIFELREKAIAYIVESGRSTMGAGFYQTQDSAYLIKEAAKIQKAIAGGAGK